MQAYSPAQPPLVAREISACFLEDLLQLLPIMPVKMRTRPEQHKRGEANLKVQLPPFWDLPSHVPFVNGSAQSPLFL